MAKKFFLFRWIENLFNAIFGVFNKLDKFTKENIDWAIELVNKAKVIDETFIGDVILYLIPGDKDDKVHKELREWLAAAIIGLNKIKDISNIEDRNEKIKAILGAIKVDQTDARKVFLHDFAALFIERISDGKLDFNDAAAIAAMVFKAKKEGKW